MLCEHWYALNGLCGMVPSIPRQAARIRCGKWHVPRRTLRMLADARFYCYVKYLFCYTYIRLLRPGVVVKCPVMSPVIEVTCRPPYPFFLRLWLRCAMFRIHIIQKDLQLQNILGKMAPGVSFRENVPYRLKPEKIIKNWDFPDGSDFNLKLIP
jgi:hypothetical protein